MGVDVWIAAKREASRDIDLARLAACETHLRLSGALSEFGDEDALAGGGPEMLRLRFVSRLDDVHLTDEAICELIACMPGNLRWVRLDKLEEIDGEAAFLALPAQS